MGRGRGRGSGRSWGSGRGRSRGRGRGWSPFFASPSCSVPDHRLVPRMFQSRASVRIPPDAPVQGAAFLVSAAPRMFQSRRPPACFLASPRMFQSRSVACKGA